VDFSVSGFMDFWISGFLDFCVSANDFYTWASCVRRMVRKKKNNKTTMNEDMYLGLNSNSPNLKVGEQHQQRRQQRRQQQHDNSNADNHNKTPTATTTSTTNNNNQYLGLNLILNEHADSKDGTPAADLYDLDAGAKEIESSSFNLVMKEIDYDLKSWRVYRAKSDSHVATIKHQKDAWQKKRYDEGKAAACAYMAAFVSCLSTQQCLFSLMVL
jgi:hypothetical protein